MGAYMAYGWPKAFSAVTSRPDLDTEAVHLVLHGDYMVAVFPATIQVWSGGQHRVKLGELTRTAEEVAEEGPFTCAHWCPSRKLLAAVTSRSHLQLYALHVSKEVLWRLPEGRELCAVAVYLRGSLHLDYGAVRVADLSGDAKSVVVALSNGTLQVFSWHAKLRGQANPFLVAAESSRSRLSRRSSSGAAVAGAGLPSRQSTSSVGEVPTSASNGSLGHVDAAAAAEAVFLRDGSVPLPTPVQPGEVEVSRLHYCPAARLVVVVLADGRAALCRMADTGIHPVEQVHLFRWIYKPALAAASVPCSSAPAASAVAAAISPAAQMLALGMGNGRVALYPLQTLLTLRHHTRPGSRVSIEATAAAGGGGSSHPEPLRVLALSDWGYSSAVVGAAEALRWSADGRALAVGYSRRGLAVWTPSGCRLMCSLRQAAPGAQGAGVAATAGATPTPGAMESPRQAAAAAVAAPPTPSALNPSYTSFEPGVLEGGVASLSWDPHGYQLVVGERGGGGVLFQLHFARQTQGHHRVLQPAAGPPAPDGLDLPPPPPQDVHILQGADRLLVISETQQAVSPALHGSGSDGMDAGARPELSLQHIALPQQYIEAAYPLLHSAVSQDRADIAVAGVQGLAVYSRRTRRWRLFGDASQERGLHVHSLAWLPGGVVAVVARVDGKEASTAPHQLLLYPRHHLDSASLLACHPLKQLPLAVDCLGPYLLLAFAPLELRLIHVVVDWAGEGGGSGVARLTTVRELSIMGMGNPLQEIALIEPHAVLDPRARQAGGSSSLAGAAAAAAARQHQGGMNPGDPESDASLAGVRLPPVRVRSTPGLAADAAAGGRGAGEPTQCVLLRAGGVMSMLDMAQGSELVLSDQIERFWLPVSTAPAGGGGGSFGASRSSGTLTEQISRRGSDAADLAASASAGSLLGLSRLATGSAARRADASPPPAPTPPDGAAAAPLGGQQAAQQAQHPAVELPWWTYGARGMQLWFPSALAEHAAAGGAPASPASVHAAASMAAASNATDPELEFDREVYPVGVSLAEVSIVGLTQRAVRSPAFPPDAPQSLCLQPLPESQPVLPCLLRRLLQQGRLADALELARWHSRGAHFARSMEWLLFTALEWDAEQAREAARGAQPGTSAAGAARARGRSGGAGGGALGGGMVSGHEFSPRGRAARRLAYAGPLLSAASRLLQQFPALFAEVVVSVARKTDAALWPSLFAAVGSPSKLGEGLLGADKLQSAACCLLLVDHMEGTSHAHALALRLIKAALLAPQYELVADLLRFLIPPGESEALLSPQALLALAGAAAAEAANGTAGGGGSGSGSPRDAGTGGQQGAGGGQPGLGSWLLSFVTGGGGAKDEAATASGDAARGEAPAREAAVAGPRAQRAEAEGEITCYTPITDAWSLLGQHAWRLLDSGALRELAQLGRALAALHGGLPALLASTAADTPAARAHTAPSAPAIASALFVASNEFASADADMDVALAAELLLSVCQEAGCVNAATALALLLGDDATLERFADREPVVWQELTSLVSNDVHLCVYAPMLSPMPSPAVVAPAGGSLARQGSGL